jgi:hypothetical protein
MSTFTLVALLLPSVFVGGAYTLLGLKARAHLNSRAKQSDHSVGWLFWWSFDKDLYDAEGRRLCQKGNLLVVPLLALYASWYVFL